MRQLTQPFFTTEKFTGLQGRLVSLADALDGCERILRDEFKDYPEGSPYMIGAVDETKRKPEPDHPAADANPAAGAERLPGRRSNALALQRKRPAMRLSPDEVIFWQAGFLKLNATIVYTWGLMLVLAVGSKLIACRLSMGLERSRWKNLLEVVIAAIEKQLEGELTDDLSGTFHRLRQSSIDEELFDVISGFEALAEPRQRPGRT